MVRRCVLPSPDARLIFTAGTDGALAQALSQLAQALTGMQQQSPAGGYGAATRPAETLEDLLALSSDGGKLGTLQVERLRMTAEKRP